MNAKRYQLVIFDWDGTLIDSQAHILSCMHHAFADQGLAVPDDDHIRHIIGLSLERAIATLSPELSAQQVHSVGMSYREHFFADPEYNSAPFEGAVDVVRDLHASGYYLAVATGKGRRGLDIALERTGLGHFFHITRCADETRSKPDPMMLDEILTDLDLAVDQAIMVGDTSYDMEMAGNIKMDSVAVTYGMHDKQQLAGSNPTHFIDTIQQLTHLV
jgi:phosphoglycolate phosphatase